MPTDYNVDATSGRIEPAHFCSSENFDARPAGSEIDTIIIHGISLPPGEFGGPAIEQLFTNCLDPNAHPYFKEIEGLTVSAHLLIRRDGELAQFVSFNDRAWHAGASSFRGRSRCNDFSIGIELEGLDDVPYEAAQYDALCSVIEALKRAYPALSNRCIAGHSDIAPGRKTDPGPAFDWLQLYDGLC